MLGNIRGYSSFSCGGVYERRARKIVVLAQRISPTRDFYLKHRLSGCSLPVVYWTLGEPCPVSLDDAFVIAVRYVDRPSIEALERSSGKLSGVAWLLDDDVAAAIGDDDLPLHYRIFMAHFWIRFARRLAGVTSEIWVASDALAERLAGCGPVQRIDPLPEPFPLPCEREKRHDDQVRIFYHGQKTHRGERRWLHRIVSEIHDRYPQSTFEIVGDGAVRKLYRKLDRVQIVSVFSWPEYLVRSRQVRFDIGLAPLLATPFNRARSWVKYLDIARFGAVGIFASGRPYDLVVRDGENGLLCPPDELEAWIEALASLIERSEYRCQLVAGVGWPEEVATPPSLKVLMTGNSTG